MKNKLWILLIAILLLIVQFALPDVRRKTPNGTLKHTTSDERPEPMNRSRPRPENATTAALIALALCSPAAEACWPWVVGQAECETGEPAEGLEVTVYRYGSPVFPPCEPQYFSTTTDANGEFSVCLGCEGYADITIDAASSITVTEAIDSAGGSVSLSATGDVTLNAAVTTVNSNAEEGGFSGTVAAGDVTPPTRSTELLRPETTPTCTCADGTMASIACSE